MQVSSQDEQKETRRGGLRWQCLALVLFAYLGLNLLLVGFVPLLHASELRVRVLRAGSGEALSGVEIREGGTSWTSVAPAASSSCLAQVVSSSRGPVRSGYGRTDGEGRYTWHTMVQDQGVWAIPRLGVRRNLAGRALELTFEGQTYRALVPRYEGQQGELRVLLPAPR